MLWNIPGGQQKSSISFLSFAFVLKKKHEEREILLLTHYLSTSLPRSFLLKRGCVLSWVKKPLMRAETYIHAGRI